MKCLSVLFPFVFSLAEAARVLDSDCSAPDTNIPEACLTDTGRALSPSCAADAVLLAIARSMTKPADTYRICLDANVALKIIEEEPHSTQLKDTMLRYVQQFPNGSEKVHVVGAPAETSEWKMVDIKGSTAGGAGRSQLFRSSNQALWLKTVDDTELASWHAARLSYSERFRSSVKDGAPRTFLARVLGIYVIGEGRCPEQCWVAILDVMPYMGAGGAEAKPTLTCDVKPHMLSASPRSYSSLDQCGELLHMQSVGEINNRKRGYLESAQADMCWLSKAQLVDFSWLFVHAAESAVGAVKIKGYWWYVGVIDFLMGYGWDSHGVQGIGRAVESQWKSLKQTKVLPKGPYNNRVWADPLMYADGKFRDYAAKQLQIFEAFAVCTPAGADGQQICISEAAAEGISTEKYSRCDASQTPFHRAGPGGLGQEFASERRQQCQKEVAKVCRRIYENIEQGYVGQLATATNYGQRYAVRSKILEKARVQQSEALSQMDQRQTKEMAALECVWDSRGREECGPSNEESWIRSGCIKLHEEW